ncbi:DNA replication protein [Schinkia azotoformans MEV2011]|uniref:DNA replication protein n=1 Tax=Schinkia azotoformans MEV2011 TaxID=1348973 RepID=A0A072NIU3_SCHAZ|nr:IS21-like element helper ATPase IstB [Schinkia azotoformans]KEF37431.1 DNA replication protein [Schinkia azotoformans MEV2011]MEC1698133.1 IS21-like element helper ATPase IstB [Schinkia azotoformans]MEC1727660.1 IS21-like element helper ATPase IstB [Schinkia azotoformans]MEC1769776.1 IS21-like element helper ATPase IstB [Schinkia azotoformans]MEC1782316.1 IS21-like element helper ATPase IstB [Schinkia azotoformans]
MDNKQQLIDICKELRLPSMRRMVLDETSFQDSEQAFEILLKVLLQEKKDRFIRAKQSRIRAANFPQKKLLDELILDYLPEQAQQKLPQLKLLDFIKEGQNVILTGSPGTGKSHIAVGLGMEACLAGYRVFFATVPSLINQLKEHRSERTLRSFELKFEKYDLVIIDELGYISFDKEGAELLFSHLSLRAGRKSTIITSNLSFLKWQDIFHDPVLTAALTDRLTHKSHVVNMVGPSFRMRETEEWMKGNAEKMVAQN